MIATTPHTTAAQAAPRLAVPQVGRPAAGDGTARPVAGGRPSVIVSLSPQAVARYAEAANQGGRDSLDPVALGQAQALSTKTLDTADADEDGRITVKEQQVYDTEWVAKQAARRAAMQRESLPGGPQPYREQASARYGAVQALAA